MYEIIARVPEHPVGWFETILPNDVVNRLQSYIETARKNPVNVNKSLVGNISNSLELKDTDDWFFKTILEVQISKFKETWPGYIRRSPIITNDVPYIMNSFWVNFQKKHEFNPIHNHTGLFSFVIWIKIPTDWREQHKIPIAANSFSPVASNFEFHYNTLLGDQGKFNYFLNKDSEGMMLFFPSGLGHTVYPFFNCDEERVSISGNIRFDTSRKVSNEK